MVDENQSGETVQEFLLNSLKSTGFWSFVTAIVGVLALVVGGALFLTIAETREFSLSVLIIGLVLLFLALVLSPRAIAIFVVGRQGRFGGNVVVMTLAFFVIVVLVNFLLFRTPTRFDVTATRVFTLSDQTQRILDSLEGGVKAHAFFIPTAASSFTARQQVDDLLNEFDRRSNNFSFRFVDPELQRSVAQKFGVTTYPVIVFEDLSDGTQQSTLSFTEQDFVTSILIATGKQQKKIYYLTGHGEAGATRDPLTGELGDSDNGFDFALQGLQRDNYRVISLSLKETGSVPEDAAVLLIAGPNKDIDQSERQALNDYIRSGGRIVGLFDPGTPSSFVEIFTQWGIVIGDTNIADALSNVAGRELTPLLQKANGQFLTSTSPLAAGIPITDQIDITFFPEATSLEPLIPIEEMPPYVKISPLGVTTPASWLESDPDNVNFDRREDVPGPFTVITVIQASGTVDEQERHDETKMVLFGDSDFAKNKFFFSSSDNGDLFLNAVNWLAEDYELIGISPKLFPYRELVVTSRERNFIKWSSWVVPPVVMLMLGTVVWWRRR
ncbi:MAG: GldG family protein [Chloroflexi bacterium]|nr:GldG family protein [Chloroflexota bacterium]